MIKLPIGSSLGPGDVLASEDGRLVRVTCVVFCKPGSAIAALVEVAPEA